MTHLDAHTSSRDSDHARDMSAAQRMEGWRLPLVLAVILVCAGVFFVLVAHGISTLASIGY